MMLRFWLTQCPILDSALRLRGDMLEVLSEIAFFNALFQNDEAVGSKRL
jgi:hypothetical protein